MRWWPVLGLLSHACAPDAEVTPPTWHADVQPIFQARCVGCHTEGGVAPFTLESWEEATAWAPAIAVEVAERTMPPWGAVAGHVDYARDPSLTDAQIETVLAWIEAGTPQGDPSEAGEPLPDLTAALERVDLTLEMAEPYVPVATEADDYRCFLLDWPEAETTWVTGFEVHPGNRAVVHHVAAFLIRPDTLLGPGVFDTFAGFDAEEEGPGYTCFGGPSGSEPVEVPVQQLAQWVPGSGAVLFPDGVGIPVPPGSQIVLQVHYNTAATEPAPDQTRLDLTLTDQVERVGAFAPWLDPAWTFGTMTIPAGEAATHEATGSPYAFFGLLLSDIDLSGGFDIHAAMLHMHRLGREGLVRVDRADGTSRVLLEIDRWDFDWQLSYELAEAEPFGPDDELHLSCTFDNTEGSADVGWGEGSAEEMCVANLFVSAPAR